MPPAYTGAQPPQSQSPTGGLGYPVGAPKPDSSGGFTPPVGQDSPYSQYPYNHTPVGSGAYGASQHAPTESVPTDSVSSDTAPTSETDGAPGSGETSPNDSAPTRASTRRRPMRTRSDARSARLIEAIGRWCNARSR
ncbi:hypothetical protein BJF84_06100 [Rhodococcus sp. CUA-806]|nr:hypothetical protein BJF84_06100 [Rhodococcus sp. CUA-806]